MISKQVSLANMCQGEAIERFNYELQKALANILDINTSTKKKRKVKLTVSITPNEERTFGDVEIICESDLAPVKEIPTKFYIGEVDGMATAFEQNPKQTTFGFDAEPSYENVKDFERKTSNE